MRKVEFYPLTAPGMPPPGPDIINYIDLLTHNRNIDDEKRLRLVEKVYKKLLYENEVTLPVRVGNCLEDVTFICGHIWGKCIAEMWSVGYARAQEYLDVPYGPRPAEVMIIGKLPGREEVIQGFNFVGPAGNILYQVVTDLKFKNYFDWYITNVVKFYVASDGPVVLRANWIKTCLPLLHQELRIVRPKYILCLGSDSLKAILGRRYTLASMEGKVERFSFPIHKSEDEPPQYHECYVCAVLHPAEVARDPVKMRAFRSGLERFKLLLEENNFRYLQYSEENIKRFYLYNYDEVCNLLNKIPDTSKIVAWDCEWHCRNPLQPDGYLRCIQFSWEPYHAAVIKITEPGGKLSFVDEHGNSQLRGLASLLNNFMINRRAVGHFLIADLEWLHYYGINPIAHCPIPAFTDEKGRPPWQQYKEDQVGWLDTAMAVHAIEETASLGLEALALRYTTAPRWDLPLEEYKKNYCKINKIPQSALKGYGDIPDEVLFPYAGYDADVTLRIMLKLFPLLDRDYNGQCCWEPFWESMFVQEVILSMHKNGILVDRERVDELTRNFMAARSALEEKIKNWAQWPDLNLRSLFQIRELIYGEKYNGKGTRLRPSTARSLGLRPLIDTGKPPQAWDEIEQRGEDNKHLPATSKSAFNLLINMYKEHPHIEVVGWLRDYRYIDQVLRTVLREPLQDDSGTYIEDEEGNFIYESGLPSFIDPDNRVRTRFLPTAETGRWRSSSPNLQNISKSRDVDYERLLGEHYKHKLRSLFIASGWGAEANNWPQRPAILSWQSELPGEKYFINYFKNIDSQPQKVLIEFDYRGAELFGMAVMAGDEIMINHVERSQYPDEGYDEHGNPCPDGKFPHPDYYDIHSNVAVMAFRLDCPPTKAGLKSINKIHFRTLAKNVIFGIAYGRGARAIALQAKEQGIDITEDDAQKIIETIFKIYPNLKPYFETAKRIARRNRWICSCFGRYRRFSSILSDSASEAEIERQAMNFPIQSMIASVMDRGLGYLYREVLNNKLQSHIKILLQIHDAAVLEVSIPYVDYVINELLPYAMRDMVPIYPTDLMGNRLNRGPYYLSYEVSIEKHWGEKFDIQEYLQNKNREESALTSASDVL